MADTVSPAHSDEDVHRIIQALHVRIEALEASIFGNLIKKVTDTGKAAVSKVVDTGKAAVNKVVDAGKAVAKAYKGNNMTPKVVYDHLHDTYQDMGFKLIIKEFQNFTLQIFYKNKVFMLKIHGAHGLGKDSYSWIFMKDPNKYMFESAKDIAKEVISIEELDNYIRTQAGS